MQVYDVGSYETLGPDGASFHDIFVVMELVPGSTVPDWLAATRRPFEEIVRVFVEAGRGLAAAHAAGLVHRDVKPSNIFVDEARVRVGDFGLARVVASSGSGFARVLSRPSDDDIANDETLSGSLTDTGMAVGTPLYMAPEQQGGALVDARGDQYAFCVALYEGLCGVRPFTGTHEALLRAKWMRALEVPARDDVPSSLRDIVYRGLAPEPSERWPSMAALVDALERAVAPRPRRTWMYATARRFCSPRWSASRGPTAAIRGASRSRARWGAPSRTRTSRAAAARRRSRSTLERAH